MSIDFLDAFENIVHRMKDVCADVTHAFFASYVHDDDLKKLPEKNVPLFKNFLDAVVAVSPKLQRVSLQTGGKVCLQICRRTESD